MGYNTDFKGELKFNQQLNEDDYRFLEQIFEIDYRKFPRKFNIPEIKPGLSYIALALTSDNSGLEWSEDEKTYEMDSALNLITILMRERIPDFRLIGEMYAQGENLGDVWKIIINEDGYAETVDLNPFKTKKCRWSLTQIEEDIDEVETNCGETMEIDKMLVRGFHYCPFCSGEIDRF